MQHVYRWVNCLHEAFGNCCAFLTHGNAYAHMEFGTASPQPPYMFALP